MRYVGILAVLVGVLFSIGAAEENPDSRPSISFNLGSQMVSGKSSVHRFINQEQDNRYLLHRYRNFDFSSEVLVPVSIDVTLLFGLGFATGEADWKEGDFFWEQITSYTRFRFSFGIKFYFGQNKKWP